MKHKLLLSAVLFFLVFNTNAQLTVTSGNTPASLVSTLVGGGVTITNISYTGNANSKGTFGCTGGCNLGMPAGIFLSSGNTGQGPTFDASSFHSTDMQTPGDAQLNTIVAPDFTLDAAVLEFDFTAATDSIHFRYVFGSEEYNEYVNSFNDVFAFFISGPGIPGGTKNIALVPGTNTPVSIDNVNNGNSSGAATGPCTNCAYYTDNVGNGGYSIFFDGFTHVMTAGIRVMPCQTYHMKFAVADVNDHVFDSGVFLEANSFSALGQIQLYANGQLQNNSDTVFVCNNDSVVLTVNPAMTYLWNTGETTQSIVVTQANVVANGQYSCAIFTPGVSCFAYTTTIKVVFQNSTSTITPLGPTALCPGGNVTLQASSGNSYLWSTGAITQNIVVNTAGTYTVTVTNSPNCTSVSTPIVITSTAPVATINGNLSICSGNSTTLTATAGTNYLWSTGATTQSISPSSTGAYTVTVTFAGGCTSSASVNLTANSNPTPSITGITSICQGNNTVLNAGAGYSSYLWSTGINTPTLTTAAGNTYTVTVTDANGCTGTTSAIVTVNALPAPAISGNTTFCQGNNSTLNAGAGYSTYLWSTGAATQTINVNTGSNYTVTVTNANGCSGSTGVAVVVNSNPTPSITGTLAFCSGTSTTLNATAGFANYQWSNGANTASISPSTGNTFTVTVTDANGCSGTTNATTTVHPLPTPIISGNASICSGTSSTLSTTVPYSTYSWSTGATTSTISVNATNTYSVTVTDANGCSNSTNFNVTVNALPVPAITGITTFCQGNNSTLNAGGGYSSYLWSTGAVTQTINVNSAASYAVTVFNANGCSAATSVAVVVNANPIPTISGNLAFCAGTSTTLNAPAGFVSYVWSNGVNTQSLTTASGTTYTVTVTDANGCSGNVSTTTNVNPLPTPVIAGNNSICTGASNILSTTVAYSTYAWSTGATTPTINANATNSYSVIVTDANGCSNNTSFSVVANPLPIAVITGTTTFCQGNSSTLNAGAGFNSYLWSTGANTQTINVNATGNYTVTISNNFGCSAFTSQLITVNALPAPAISGANGICAGGSTTLNAGSGYSGYLWSTGAITQTITPSVATTYSVTVTDANNCSATVSKTLQVFALPTPSITGVNTVCQGINSTFDAGAGFASYLWSTGATSQTIAVNTANNYSVIVTDANGCTGNTARTLTVNPVPSTTITGNTVFCSGNTSVLNGGAGFSSYLWSPGGATTRTITVSNGGSYTVVVSNNFGCTSSASTVVTVNNLPVPVISGPSGFCIGSQATINAGSGYATYLWSTGATTQTITTNVAGSYDVTITDANGCSGSATKTLIQNSLPTPVITGTAAICQGNTSTLNAGLYAAYVWSTGATTQTINAGINGLYSVTVIDANGCSNSNSFNLTVNALPAPSISGVTAFCIGASSTLNAGNNYVNYVWSTGAVTPSITVTASNNYQVTVTDANGCSSSTSQLVIAWALPNPVITGSAAVCSGLQSTLSAGSFTNYSWSTGATTPTISTGTAGNYTVIVTDSNGCENTSPAFSLTIYDLPTATLNSNATICFGQSTSFQLTLTGTPPYSYSYSNGTGVFGPYSTSNGTPTLTLAPSATTTYTIISISDAHCSGTYSGAASVTVNPLPTPVITGLSEICNGKDAILHAGNYQNYSWSTGAATASITVSAAAVYSCTVTDLNGCSNVAQHTLTVNETPVIVFSNDTSLTCEAPIIHFFNTSSFPQGSVFNWDFADGSTSTDENPQHQFSQPGNFPISLTITTDKNCMATLVKDLNIDFYPLPVAKFTASPKSTSMFNSGIELVDQSENAVRWKWDLGDGFFSAEPSLKHSYPEPGKYIIKLTVENIAGCISETVEDVNIVPLFMPNAFSPNNDGRNDVFFDPGYAFDVKTFSMKIFNRWGQLMFSTDNLRNAWDGSTPSGTLAPDGVYVYQLSITNNNDKKFQYNGTVSLIR
jgi:gliding motility-associated-like protein